LEGTLFQHRNYFIENLVDSHLNLVTSTTHDVTMEKSIYM
jgi:hypothetical protein